MAAPGVSTLGVLFGYGVETVAGTKPEKFTLLTRITVSYTHLTLPTKLEV